MQKAAVNNYFRLREYFGIGTQPPGISQYLRAWRTLLDIRVPTPCTPLTHLLSSIGCCRLRSEIRSVNPEASAASYL